MKAHESLFPKLSSVQIERLALLIEECGEVIQAASKVLRHGCKVLRHGYASYHPETDANNRDTLEEEIGDLLAAVKFLVAGSDVGPASSLRISESIVFRAALLSISKNTCGSEPLAAAYARGVLEEAL